MVQQSLCVPHTHEAVSVHYVTNDNKYSLRRQLKGLAMHWGGWPSHKQVPASVSYTALIHMYIIWGCYTSYRHRTEGRVLLHYTPHIILLVAWRICVTVQLHHCSKHTAQSYLDPLPSPSPAHLHLSLIMFYVAVCVTEVTLLPHHTISEGDAVNDQCTSTAPVYVVCMGPLKESGTLQIWDCMDHILHSCYI